MKARRFAFLGLCVALSMILSYIESLIPPLVAVPGVKVGLPNLIVTFMLYRFGFKETAAVSLIRVVLVSILFGSVVSMIYSLVGAALSLAGMILLQKSEKFSIVTVSVVGGVLHNIGQIITAVLIMETAQLIYYLPVLLISGSIAGMVIGLTASLIVKRMESVKI